MYDYWSHTLCFFAKRENILLEDFNSYLVNKKAVLIPTLQFPGIPWFGFLECNNQHHSGI